MSDAMNLDSSDWDETMFEDVFGDVPEYIRLVVFLIDSSGSMEGKVIGSINSIMEELLSELEKDKGHKRITGLTFDREVTWLNQQPQTIEEFGGWHRIRGGALSNMGEAFRQLAQRLSVPGWCPQGSKGIMGKFILFSDGLATDHYEEGLEILGQIPVFQKGDRLAVNLSDKTDMEVLRAFTGKEENVLQLNSNEISEAQKRLLSVITN